MLLYKNMPIYTISEENAKGFSSLLKEHDRVICLYHWTQCGHCVTLAPIWQRVTSKYKGKINVANIEYKSMLKMEKKYKVNGFPYVVVYKDGKKHVEFTSMRTEANLDAFIKEHLLDDKKKTRQPKKV